MTGLRIVFASHTAELGFFTVGSHHLSRSLAARGHRVVHIASPLGALHLLRSADAQVRARARAARAGLVAESRSYASLVPALAAPVTAAQLISSPRWWATAVGPGLRQVPRFLGGPPDLVLLDQPSMCTLATHLNAAAVIVRSTDVVSSAVKQRGFARAVAGACGLIGTSGPALEQLRAVDCRGLPHSIIANGVDFDRFAAHRADWDARHGCVYVGALDERFDWDFISAAARRLPEERFDIFGPKPAAVPDLPPNVHLPGPVPYAEVPALLNGYRLGLLPLVDNRANHGRSPMKLYEYLAAGLRVVSSAAEAMPRELPGCRLVPMGADPTAAVTASLQSPPPPAARAAAAQMSWTARADALEEFIHACC